LKSQALILMSFWGPRWVPRRGGAPWLFGANEISQKKSTRFYLKRFHDFYF
jgi:hypothetical protein